MKQNNNDKQQQPKRKKGAKALKDRVNKHINDKNDVITDEDMKNIEVSDEVSTEENKSAEQMAEAVKIKKADSPWTILTEDDK